MADIAMPAAPPLPALEHDLNTTEKHEGMSQVRTPPASDQASSHKDDDAASSSSLSDLGDDILDEENRIRFEEAARAGAEAEQYSEVKPDRYENGVPIFRPVRAMQSRILIFDVRHTC